MVTSCHDKSKEQTAQKCFYSICLLWGKLRKYFMTSDSWSDFANNSKGSKSHIVTPLAKNTSASGRAKNRRTEIEFQGVRAATP